MLWIKMYPAKCLRGSLRFDLPYQQRGIWYELLLIAGDLDQDGVIDYPVSFIASQLGCPLKALEDIIRKLEETKRINRTSNQIHILNWRKYQTSKPTNNKREPSVNHPPQSLPAAKKTPYGSLSNVLLTSAEYSKLQERFGPALPAKLETLSLGIAAHGYKYKSHYAALLTWDKKDRESSSKPSQAKTPPAPVKQRRTYDDGAKEPHKMLTDAKGMEYYIDPGTGMRVY